MVTRLGTVLGTPLGTTLSGFNEAFDSTAVYSLGGTSLSNYYATQTGGFETGISTGFGILSLWIFDTLGVSRYFGNRGTSSGNNGYLWWINASNAIVWLCGSGAGAAITSNGHTIQTSEVGKVVALLGWHDGTRARLACCALPPVVSGTAITGYTANTGPYTISGFTSPVGQSTPATGMRFIGDLAFRGTPTDAHLTALLTATRLYGDVAPKADAEAAMPGTSVTRRHSVRETLAAVGQPVVDSSAAPATIADSVTVAAVDALNKTGSMIVRYERAVPRQWAYEATPVFSGPASLSSANFYDSTFDDASSAAGFWFAYLLIPPNGTNTAGIFGGAASGNTGWDARVAANHANFSWSMGDGTTYTQSATASVVTNKLNLFVCVWDQPNLKQRVYAGRAEVGTGTVRTGYTPPTTTKIGFGRSPRDAASALGTRTLLGFAMGNGVPTLAEVQAMYDSAASTDRMPSVPGKTSVLVDTTLDGGNPASLTNRAGSGSFTRSGAPTLGTTLVRQYAW